VHSLRFRWDEIHEIAEELEHVSHPELIARLDTYLGNPTEDPHGELIPGAQLQMPNRPTRPMNSLTSGERARVVCVDEGSDALLKYLDQIELRPGSEFTLISVEEFDQSMRIRRVDGSEWRITREVSNNVQVERIDSMA
jgi:DtxR family Mn-dependent transcriptional regulator